MNIILFIYCIAWCAMDGMYIVEQVIIQFTKMKQYKIN